jgi:hypothetical protein
MLANLKKKKNLPSNFIWNFDGTNDSPKDLQKFKFMLNYFFKIIQYLMHGTHLQIRYNR